MGFAENALKITDNVRLLVYMLGFVYESYSGYLEYKPYKWKERIQYEPALYKLVNRLLQA